MSSRGRLFVDLALKKLDSTANDVKKENVIPVAATFSEDSASKLNDQLMKNKPNTVLSIIEKVSPAIDLFVVPSEDQECSEEQQLYLMQTVEHENIDIMNCGVYIAEDYNSQLGLHEQINISETVDELVIQNVDRELSLSFSINSENNDETCGSSLNNSNISVLQNESSEELPFIGDHIVGLSKKRKRSKNTEEQREHYKQKYKLLKGCSENCRLKCSEIFSEEERIKILENLWTKDFGGRRQYFETHILQKEVKQRKVLSEISNRQVSLVYSLPCSDGTHRKVCKTMFLHTHGLKTDGMVTEYIKAKKNNNGIPNIIDKRGKLPKTNLVLDNLIVDHINSYQPQISHYRLENSPHRRYLPSDITITSMWTNYCESLPDSKVSYEKFRTLFEKENIGFGKPSEDECGLCEKHKYHECEKESNSSTNCDICVQHDEHVQRYTEARQAYSHDKDTIWGPNYKIYTSDMQKILILPKMKIKNIFFVSRLVVFNETFASLKKDEDSVCVLWHEAISGRTSKDLASAYFKITSSVASKPTDKIIFWADNCSAQNKNWLLYSVFLLIVNKDWGPETITIKYLEVGHTYMKADSIHGQIGSAWKRTEEILNFEDMKRFIENVSKHTQVMEMLTQDFYNFEDFCKRRTRNCNTPLLSEIKVAEFRKGSNKLYYTKSHTAEFIEASILKKHIVIDKVPLPVQNCQPRGLNSQKKVRIITELIPYMPFGKRQFWQQLPTSSEAKDLCSHF